MNRLMGLAGAVWGVAGVLALLVFAIVRLAGVFAQANQWPFSWQHWSLLIVSSLFMAYSEGYKGFQRGYSPRVVARARHIFHEPTLARVVFAPFFCMGYFQTTKRRLIVAYVLTIAIISMVILFRFLEQPWRGILDFSVVIGLSWGSISIALYALKVATGGRFDHSPEMPCAELPPELSGHAAATAKTP